MRGGIYILCTLTTGFCSFLLLRRHAQAGVPLLLWSGLCFVGLTAANLLVFVDLVLVPNVDLYLFRLLTAAVSTLLLVYGLVNEQ